MNYGFLRAAAASLRLRVADPSYNKNEIISAIEKAEGMGPTSTYKKPRGSADDFGLQGCGAGVLEAQGLLERYDAWFRPNSNDMIAITGYYKYLETPIERTQWVSGGAREYSFQNATDGLAAGIEVEVRKEIIKNLSTSVNASYMYTNVQLPSGMVYTNTERQLQGASPYIVNADLSYTPSFGKDRKLSVALLYNLQGKRIQAVGIQKQGDVYQETLHTLNLNLGYQFNKRLSAKVQVKNLLNSDFVLSQELPVANKTVEVERYEDGIDLDLSVSYKF